MTYRKEGIACRRIPYDPTSREADCEYPLWQRQKWKDCLQIYLLRAMMAGEK